MGPRDSIRRHFGYRCRANANESDGLRSSDLVAVGADVVVVSATKVLSPGRIAIRDGRVIDVSETSADCNVYLPGCALLPGLVNSHAHLEFSDLAEPIPAGDSFPSWIGSVVAHRRRLEQECAQRGVSHTQYRSDAVRKGLGETYLTGTALVADIVTEPWDELAYQPAEAYEDETARHIAQRAVVRGTAELLRELPGAGPSVIALAEVLGLDAERMAASCADASRRVESSSSTGTLLHTVGVSPHSPYSILFDQASQLVESLPPETRVAMHLAESPEELKWLSSTSGPFREAFERIGVAWPNELPTIDSCLEMLSGKRSLVVHGNYLTKDQMQWIASHDNLSVVYCPRTHAYFGHTEYPLKQLLALGVRVVLGTDSRASNPDLDLWQEVRFARWLHPELSAPAALSMVTDTAAEALNVKGQFGSLNEHFIAAPSVAELKPNESGAALLERLTTQSDTPPLVRPLRMVVKAFRQN